MRVKEITLFLFLFLCFGINLTAQHRNCGSMEYLEQQMQEDPKRVLKMEAIENHVRQFLNNAERDVNGVITIPTVVHVIYNNSTENISDNQIYSQMTVLTDDFRRLNSDANGDWPQADDSEIEFCLATVDPTGASTSGITRTSTNVSSFPPNDNMKFFSSGGHDAWPAGDYLNIWVCDLSSGLLGYAQFPGGSPATDGVVCDYAYFGTEGTATPPFDLGRTATHEVGHWLNLRHIWGDGGCSVDDFVSDTPTSDAANYGCASGHVSCGTTDMVENYMDYSDDACMNLFTNGQKVRMRALFDPGGFRESLLSSNGCGSGGPPTCTDGIQNGNETGVDCGGPDCPACPTCSDGIQNGQETGVDCGGPDCAACPCLDNEITVTINLDNYPEETSWEITDANNNVVASGGTYGNLADGSTVVENLCLIDGCYDFTINDSYGDGICCGYGNGSYSVTDANNNTLASGGQFGYSETTNFCLSGGGGPTCNDGIMNGQETGVDCGGPDCPACPTCNDGIMNGQETGIDCGGPDCPACPTCNDGIMNGQETGVDCGGPDCPPCQTGCSYVTIDNNNFDSGWGIWNDGGSDCRRSANDAAYANSGTRCVRLRDNSSTSVMTTDNLDLSSYDELSVDFTYYPRSMDGVEDFWLQISTNGGSSYTTVEDWVRGTDFQNNVREFPPTVVIPGPFTSNTRLRFRCDASGNKDWIYIDDVVITGCQNGARQQNPGEPSEESSNFTERQPLKQSPKSVDFKLFPNPTNNILNVEFSLQSEEKAQLMVTDFTGKMLEQRTLDAFTGTQQTQIDASQLAPGFYFVHLLIDGKLISKKFVVTK